MLVEISEGLITTQLPAAIAPSQKDLKKAKQYFAEAESLDPNNWNIHRQDWALTDKKAQNRNWRSKVTKLKKPYYAPLDLPK